MGAHSQADRWDAIRATAFVAFGISDSIDHSISQLERRATRNMLMNAQDARIITDSDPALEMQYQLLRQDMRQNVFYGAGEGAQLLESEQVRTLYVACGRLCIGGLRVKLIRPHVVEWSELALLSDFDNAELLHRLLQQALHVSREMGGMTLELMADAPTLRRLQKQLRSLAILLGADLRTPAPESQALCDQFLGVAHLPEINSPQGQEALQLFVF